MAIAARLSHTHLLMPTNEAKKKKRAVAWWRQGKAWRAFSFLSFQKSVGPQMAPRT